jgi:hypothetical protein
MRESIVPSGMGKFCGAPVAGFFATAKNAIPVGWSMTQLLVAFTVNVCAAESYDAELMTPGLLLFAKAFGHAISAMSTSSDATVASSPPTMSGAR